MFSDGSFVGLLNEASNLRSFGLILQFDCRLYKGGLKIGKIRRTAFKLFERRPDFLGEHTIACLSRRWCSSPLEVASRIAQQFGLFDNWALEKFGNISVGNCVDL